MSEAIKQIVSEFEKPVIEIPSNIMDAIQCSRLDHKIYPIRKCSYQKETYLYVPGEIFLSLLGYPVQERVFYVPVLPGRS